MRNDQTACFRALGDVSVSNYLVILFQLTIE